MKKLVFIAAVIAVGLAQAASVDWQISQKTWTMSDSSKPNGVSVYLFDTTATGYSDFVAALAGGTLGDSISASTLTGAAGYVATATSYSSGTAAMLNNYYGRVTKQSSTIGGDDGERAFSIIVLDGQNYLVSGNQNGSVYTDPDDASTATFGAAQMTANGWKLYEKASGGGGEDVPEPTSGLLLALGGAMLALRRRRA